MIAYMGSAFCPTKTASKCQKGDTCERVYNALREEKASSAKLSICLFSSLPSCFSLWKPSHREKVRQMGIEL
jgi:hypothetical protein